MHCLALQLKILGCGIDWKTQIVDNVFFQELLLKFLLNIWMFKSSDSGGKFEDREELSMNEWSQHKLAIL